MTNLEKLLHDSDKADMELSKRIANIEKDSGWVNIDLTSLSFSPSSSSIVSETANKIRFRKIGNVVHFDFRVRFSNSDTNNVMLNLTGNSKGAEFMPAISKVCIIRSTQYVSDNDVNTHPVWIQFNSGSVVSLSLFLTENKKFNTINGKVVTGQGSYIID